MGHLQCSLQSSLCRSHAARYCISIQPVHAVECLFFFLGNKSYKSPDKLSLFRSLRTPLFLPTGIRPSQLPSFNTPRLPGAFSERGRQRTIVSQSRVDSPVDQEHLGQSQISSLLWLHLHLQRCCRSSKDFAVFSTSSTTFFSPLAKIPRRSACASGAGCARRWRRMMRASVDRSGRRGAG